MSRASLLLLLMLCSLGINSQTLYSTEKGNIKFVSEASLETITAQSDECKGILNLNTGQFAFKVSILSFSGFNSSVQKVHFAENYMESAQYESAIFSGRILESIQLKEGEQKIFRAKGELEIHGVKQERVLEISLKKSDQSIEYSAEFQVPVADHGINIPNIVRQKIAEDINVSVNGNLNKRA